MLPLIASRKRERSLSSSYIGRQLLNFHHIQPDTKTKIRTILEKTSEEKTEDKRILYQCQKTCPYFDTSIV